MLNRLLYATIKHGRSTQSRKPSSVVQLCGLFMDCSPVIFFCSLRAKYREWLPRFSSSVDLPTCGSTCISYISCMLCYVSLLPVTPKFTRSTLTDKDVCNILTNFKKKRSKAICVLCPSAAEIILGATWGSGL